MRSGEFKGGISTAVTAWDFHTCKSHYIQPGRLTPSFDLCLSVYQALEGGVWRPLTCRTLAIHCLRLDKSGVLGVGTDRIPAELMVSPAGVRPFSLFKL